MKKYFIIEDNQFHSEWIIKEFGQSSYREYRAAHFCLSNQSVDPVGHY